MLEILMYISMRSALRFDMSTCRHLLLLEGCGTPHGKCHFPESRRRLIRRFLHLLRGDMAGYRHFRVQYVIIKSACALYLISAVASLGIPTM